MRNYILAAIGLLIWAVSARAASAEVAYLWPNGAPGSEGKSAPESVRVMEPNGDHVISSVHRPSLTIYRPSAGTATGAGVILAPGGGHSALWVDHEGFNEAQWFSEHGIAAFVLKYRLAREKGSTYTIEETSLGDMQRALRLVRSRAEEWSVDPDRVGVMGFSAGGELAALAATRFDTGNAAAADPIDRFSSRPAFFALMYPAIPKDMKLSKDTPPAFLACGENDRLNIAQGLPELYLAIKKSGGSAELHVYAGTGHGFGLRPTLKGEVSHWPSAFRDWLEDRKFLVKK